MEIIERTLKDVDINGKNIAYYKGEIKRLRNRLAIAYDFEINELVRELRVAENRLEEEREYKEKLPEKLNRLIREVA